MTRKIAIVDESGDISQSRSFSLEKKLREIRPSEVPKHPDLSWSVIQQKSTEILNDIANFWLIWVHDRGPEYSRVMEAVISHKRQEPSWTPPIVVAYGGGAPRELFSTYEITKFLKGNENEDSVLRRIIWTWDKGNRHRVINFGPGHVDDWEIEGFLRAAARDFYDVDSKFLLGVLIGNRDASDGISMQTFMHGVCNLISTVKGKLRANEAKLFAVDRLQQDAPAILYDLDSRLHQADKVKTELQEELKDVRSGLKKLKDLYAALGSDKGSVEEIASVIQSLHAICQSQQGEPKTKEINRGGSR